MRFHVHRGREVETIRSATWADPETGELRAGRVTERARRCEVCRCLIVVTERDGRRWRRTYPPRSFDTDAPRYRAGE